MSRSHRKQREWKKLACIMKNVDLDMEKQRIYAEENLWVSGLFGYKDHTARSAINKIEKKR